MDGWIIQDRGELGKTWQWGVWGELLMLGYWWSLMVWWLIRASDGQGGLWEMLCCVTGMTSGHQKLVFNRSYNPQTATIRTWNVVWMIFFNYFSHPHVLFVRCPDQFQEDLGCKYQNTPVNFTPVVFCVRCRSGRFGFLLPVQTAILRLAVPWIKFI